MAKKKPHKDTPNARRVVVTLWGLWACVVVAVVAGTAGFVWVVPSPFAATVPLTAGEQAIFAP